MSAIVGDITHDGDYTITAVPGPELRLTIPGPGWEIRQPGDDWQPYEQDDQDDA